MAKSKHRGKRPQKLPTYDPRETDAALSEDLRQALKASLSLAQLIEMEKQLRRSLEVATKIAAKAATEEAYKRSFACIFRVLKDRFGFGKTRLRSLFEACLDYIHDVDEGLYTTEEMLQCLENEDGIRITWNVQICQPGKTGTMLV